MWNSDRIICSPVGLPRVRSPVALDHTEFVSGALGMRFGTSSVGASWDIRHIESAGGGLQSSLSKSPNGGVPER